MKKILISTVLIISIIVSFTFSPAYADTIISAKETDNISAETRIINDDFRIIGDKDCIVFFAPTADNSPIKYQTDENGFLQGVQGFYVDNGFCYLLSTSSNSIIQYKNSKQCSQLCFDSYGFTAVYFAVSGEHIFVIDSGMNLHIFKDGRILDSYCLYDAFLSEAIEDVYCVNGKLYICINDFETMGFATYVFAFVNGKIVLEQNVDAMLLEGQSYSQTTSAARSSSALTTITNNGVSITIPSEGEHLGLLYLGTNIAGESKVKTVEIINHDEDTYYFKESLKILSVDGAIAKEIVIPQQKKPFVGNVKTINGSTYLLLTMDEYILVVNVDDVEELSFPYVFPNYIERIDGTDYLATSSNNTRLTTSRSAIISIAVSYGGSFGWTCTQQNLLPLGSWTKPSYVIVGPNYSMPYCWGGFDTRSSFQTGLNSGGRAGNACLTWVGNTYGLDCAGLVCRAWGSTTKYNTNSMHNVGSIIDWDDVSQGDALVGSTHCVLVNYVNASGNYAGYECTLEHDYDRVIGFSRSSGSFSGYTPYKCDGITN